MCGKNPCFLVDLLYGLDRISYVDVTFMVDPVRNSIRRPPPACKLGVWAGCPLKRLAPCPERARLSGSNDFVLRFSSCAVPCTKKIQTCPRLGCPVSCPRSALSILPRNRLDEIGTNERLNLPEWEWEHACIAHSNGGSVGGNGERGGAQSGFLREDLAEGFRSPAKYVHARVSAEGRTRVLLISSHKDIHRTIAKFGIKQAALTRQLHQCALVLDKYRRWVTLEVVSVIFLFRNLPVMQDAYGIVEKMLITLRIFHLIFSSNIVVSSYGPSGEYGN